jgi:hypothetical protein
MVFSDFPPIEVDERLAIILVEEMEGMRTPFPVRVDNRLYATALPG